MCPAKGVYDVLILRAYIKSLGTFSRINGISPYFCINLVNTSVLCLRSAEIHCAIEYLDFVVRI